MIIETHGTRDQILKSLMIIGTHGTHATCVSDFLSQSMFPIISLKSV